MRFRMPFAGRAPADPDDYDPYENARVMVDSISLQNGYYQTPSLTNHFAITQGDQFVEDLWTGNAQGPATIRLDNAVLTVQGDLDVRDLWGDNSTLYVNGDLYLNGGRLEAGTKGMLIFADNVFMEARGDFRGLIAARQNLVLRPLKSGERLCVNGAVLCGGQSRMARMMPKMDASGQVVSSVGGTGSLVVDSTTIQYDAKYTRALNRLGLARALLFRELP